MTTTSAPPGGSASGSGFGTTAKASAIRKGDEKGMFHFGGSTHCLFFGPDVTLDFDLHGQTPGLDSSNIPINARIATVGPRKG